MQEDASVMCWGDNSYGQLGQGDAAYRGDDLNGQCAAALQEILTRTIAADRAVMEADYFEFY